MKFCIIENIVGFGLNLGYLRFIFKRSGEDGLIDVFFMKNSLGKLRVILDKKVLGECILKLCVYFSLFLLFFLNISFRCFKFSLDLVIFFVV